MAFVPTFKLYDKDDNFLYMFPIVQYTNAPQPITKSVVIEGLRGQGAIIIPGSTGSWDLVIRGVLTGDNYEAITAKIDALESAVAYNTRYIIKIQKSAGQNYEYKVKRVEQIEYPENLRTDSQEYIIKLKTEAWVT